MRKSFLFLLSILFLNLSSYTQNLDIDTTDVLNEVLESDDALFFDYIESLNDTITKKDLKVILNTLSKNAVIPQDYIESLDDTVTINGMNDVLEIFMEDSVLPSDYMLYLNDTEALDSIQGFFKMLNVLDSTMNYEMYFYNQLLSFVKDSLFFDEPDSTYFVVYKLNNLIKKDTILLNDSTKQAIEKLINYTTSRKIKSAINYLKYKIDSTEFEFDDPSLKILNDSIYNAVSYLLKTISEDSVDLYFTNIKGDSKLFRTATDDVDSIRINLYDNRGEKAVLWVKKTDTNVYNFYVEDGVYLEKSRTKKVRDHGLVYDTSWPELKEMKMVEKIIPIWTFRGSADIKFDYGFVSKSWSEDGESSMSTLSILKYIVDYSYGKVKNFNTEVEYDLGYMQTGNDDIQKNNDRFTINIKYGTSAFNDWYYSGFIYFKTQFFDGFDYDDDTTILRSGFLSPADLVFSVGIDYKPNSKFTVLMSPLTSKYTIFSDTVNYDQTHFGVKQDKKFRREFGAYVNATWIVDFNEKIKLVNKLNLFTNYTENPQNIDVDWKFDLGFMLTDYIKVSIYAHFIYDDDVSYIDENYEKRGARPQLKQISGIGFSYNF